MATLVKCGSTRINLDNVTHVENLDKLPNPHVIVFLNVGSLEVSTPEVWQAHIDLFGEEADAFLFVWDRMAVNALREYQREQSS